MAYTLRENKEMQQMCKNVGFKVRIPVGESESVIEMDLCGRAAAGIGSMLQ